MPVAERLRRAREKLFLTQEYVASHVGLPRTAIVQIESGNRKVSAEELAALCSLYGVSADYILGKDVEMGKNEMFARSFEALSDSDKDEILSLIEFKRQMAARRR